MFVSAYTKLLALLTDSVTDSSLVSISSQLTEIKIQLDKVIAQMNRGIYNIPNFETSHLLQSMTEVQALRYLQELIANQEVQKALSILHTMRYTNDAL